MEIIFHYPPELLRLLTDALPRLCKSKKDVLLFFKGAGIPSKILAPYFELHRSNGEQFKKHTVVQEVLVKLNEAGERGLRDRREVLKRVVEFEDFSLCWPEDQAVARGLVAQIRELVNKKDAFSRMNLEREKERNQRLEIERKKVKELQQKKQELQDIKNSFYALFNEQNPYKRGKAVEGILNRYFKHSDISISEAITLKGNSSEGIIEQIDGVIQINGQPYLVEVKWEKETLGREKISSHIVRIFGRSYAGGIFISYSDYSSAAITDCTEALREKVIVLCKFSEIVHFLENEKNLKTMLETKINAAVINKNPFLEIRA